MKEKIDLNSLKVNYIILLEKVISGESSTIKIIKTLEFDKYIIEGEDLHQFMGISCKYSNLEMVKYFINRGGADILNNKYEMFGTDINGNIASYIVNDEIYQYLKSKGLDIDNSLCNVYEHNISIGYFLVMKVLFDTNLVGSRADLFKYLKEYIKDGGVIEFNDGESSNPLNKLSRSYRDRFRRGSDKEILDILKWLFSLPQMEQYKYKDNVFFNMVTGNTDNISLFDKDKIKIEMFININKQHILKNFLNYGMMNYSDTRNAIVDLIDFPGILEDVTDILRFEILEEMTNKGINNKEIQKVVDAFGGLSEIGNFFPESFVIWLSKLTRLEDADWLIKSFNDGIDHKKGVVKSIYHIAVGEQIREEGHKLGSLGLRKCVYTGNYLIDYIEHNKNNTMLEFINGEIKMDFVIWNYSNDCDERQVDSIFIEKWLKDEQNKDYTLSVELKFKDSFNHEALINSLNSTLRNLSTVSLKSERLRFTLNSWIDSRQKQLFEISEIIEKERNEIIRRRQLIKENMVIIKYLKDGVLESDNNNEYRTQETQELELKIQFLECLNEYLTFDWCHNNLGILEGEYQLMGDSQNEYNLVIEKNRENIDLINFCNKHIDKAFLTPEESGKFTNHRSRTKK